MLKNNVTLPAAPFTNYGWMLVLLAALSVLTLALQRSAPSASPAFVSSSIAADGAPSVLFVPNVGQVEEDVAYYAQGRTTGIAFTSTGLRITLTSPYNSSQLAQPHDTFLLSAPAQHPAQPQRWVLNLDFVNAQTPLRPVAQNPASTKISYFTGSQSNWRSGLTTYQQLRYADLWPGIDLIYNAAANQVKYSFLVHPGADPSKIRLAYRGFTNWHHDPDGSLVIQTSIGDLRDEAPTAQQHSGQANAVIPVSYRFVPQENGLSYGFELGIYDKSLPLIIDPAIVVYAGYVGAGNSYDIAVDNSGDAYLTGVTGTTEASFPVVAGPDLTYNGGATDAFVAKVKADGTGLVYVGYIGGVGNDGGQGIAVDGAGSAYVTGYNSIAAANIPGAGGNTGGSGSAFVAKIKADGSGLDYLGYIGGTSSGTSIAVDSIGNAYISGEVKTDAPIFPATVGPMLSYNGGSQDAFVAKIRADGGQLDYAGYIGGAGVDFGWTIAVDATGHAYVAGETSSSQARGFPVVGGPSLTFHPDPNNIDTLDGFVVKVKADGSGFDYAGYIGGSKEDYIRAIDVDSVGNAYVVGTTSPNGVGFPVTTGPDLTANGGFDAFVAKVRADGTGLVYAGYVGGNDRDAGFGVAVDGEGNACISGVTSSDEASFPVKSGPDLTYNGGGDAFLASVRGDGSNLHYAGYIGGTGSDMGLRAGADLGGECFLVGDTSSDEASFPVTVGPDLTLNGTGTNVFVAKVLGQADTLPTHTPTAASTRTPTTTATPSSTASPTTVIAPDKTINRLYLPLIDGGS